MSKERDELLIAGHTADVILNSSPMRTNILSWMDFRQGESVLLVDSDEEVIRDFFKEKEVCVSACSSSKIYDEKGPFDYVILMGVVDKYLVQAANAALRTGGKLIVAVQNRMGLMYQAGVPNFYTKKSLDSVYGRDLKHSIVQKELVKLLTKNGFASCKMFYPMPDYRLATEIYSAECLPKTGLISKPSPSYEGDYIIEIDEVSSYERALEMEKFPEVANSYLLIGVKGDSNRAFENTIYAKYNSLRAPEYRVATQIFSDGAQKYVEKWAMEDTAIAHLKNMEKGHELLEEAYCDIKPVAYEVISEDRLRFDFAKGTSLIAGLDFIVDSKGKIIDTVNAGLDAIFAVKDQYKTTFSVTDAFKAFYGDVDATAFVGMDAFSVANLDSTFNNFIAEDSFRLSKAVICLDYEWVVDFPVPVKYLKYRNLIYIYRENKKAFSERVKDEVEFLSWFDFSSEEIAACEIVEQAFQIKIHGEDLQYNYLPHYQWRAWTKEEWKAEKSIAARIKRKILG